MSRLGIEEPETKAAVQAASADSGEVASRLNEVEGILAKSSLDYLYDTDACTSAVLDSFLQSTNDTFTRYDSADRYSSYVDVSGVGGLSRRGRVLLGIQRPSLCAGCV